MTPENVETLLPSLKALYKAEEEKFAVIEKQIKEVDEMGVIACLKTIEN